MIACFYNKENIGEVIHLNGVKEIKLTKRNEGDNELMYYIYTKFEQGSIMLPYDKWRLMWADTRW